MASDVALPSIRSDLGFSQTSLAWVVNACMLAFGGFLLLAGRLGDVFGHPWGAGTESGEARALSGRL